MSTLAQTRFQWQRWAKNGFRLLIGLGLLWVTMRSIAWSDLIEALDSLLPVWLLAAGIVFFAGFPVRCLRWDVLLKANQIAVPFLNLIRYYLRSQFFLMIVPSFIGADAARSWDIHKSTGQPVEGVSSVLVERIIGLNAVTLLGFMAIWFPLDIENFTTIRLISTGLFLGVTFGWFLLLEGRLLLWMAKFIPGKRINEFIRRMLETISAYRPRVLMRVWVYSLLTQAIAIAFIYLLLRALQYDSISVIEVAAVTSILTMITIVPISPGALGLQEGAYIVFLGALGVSDANGLMVSLLSRFFLLLSAIIGGLDLVIAGETASKDR